MAKTILLVDDADLFLQMERMIFQRTGARLLMARTGREALELALRERPDVVLLDLVLPDVPGDRICAQLKAHPATSTAVIVMVTAYGKLEEQMRCLEAGCDEFITKPIKNHELLHLVAQHLKVPHRHTMRVLVRIEVSGTRMGDSFFGTSTDISKSGMFLELDKRLNVGEEITVRFFLPGHQEVLMKAKIVREDRQGAAIGYGIQFAALDPMLEKFIQSKMK